MDGNKKKLHEMFKYLSWLNFSVFQVKHHFPFLRFFSSFPNESITLWFICIHFFFTFPPFYYRVNDNWCYAELIIHLSVDRITSLEMFKFLHYWKITKLQTEDLKSHTKKNSKKKNPTNRFADSNFYCIEWVKEIKRKWIKARLCELLFFLCHHSNTTDLQVSLTFPNEAKC